MRSEFLLGDDGVLRCPELNGFVFAKHGFGTRMANPPVDVTLRQIHSDRIWDVRGLADREQEGDALLTGELNRAIGVRTADCVPILVLDPQTHAIGAIHAGWRGSAAEIALRAVRQLTQDIGPLHVAIGPCIRACCYEVGPEVSGQFVSQFGEWGGEIRRRPLDLAEANRRQLLRGGVPDHQIFDCGLCTACSPDLLFSYRREPANPGRMLSAISRVS